MSQILQIQLNNENKFALVKLEEIETAASEYCNLITAEYQSRHPAKFGKSLSYTKTALRSGSAILYGLVCLHDNSIAGMICVKPFYQTHDAIVGEVGGLLLRSSLRGMGLGSLIVQSLVSELKGKFRNIELCAFCVTTHAASQAAFLRAGFFPVALLLEAGPDLFGNGNRETAAYMRFIWSNDQGHPPIRWRSYAELLFSLTTLINPAHDLDEIYLYPHQSRLMDFGTAMLSDFPNGEAVFLSSLTEKIQVVELNIKNSESLHTAVRLLEVGFIITGYLDMGENTLLYLQSLPSENFALEHLALIHPFQEICSRFEIDRFKGS
jgi:hypothetical protein